MTLIFQSTLPVWGATLGPISKPYIFCISIHAPRVGSDGILYPYSKVMKISIHAPRVGSDITACNDGRYGRISIHAPRVGSDW